MIVSPKRVLWPTDFSDLSLQAGRYARGFSELSGAEMHVVHVVPPPIVTDAGVVVPAEVPISISEAQLLTAANEALERVIKTHFDGDARIVRRALSGGAPWREICRYAEDNEIDLIVVSTHGHTGWRHTLLGSTAERIIQHAPCPVLTVKHPERECLVE